MGASVTLFTALKKSASHLCEVRCVVWLLGRGSYTTWGPGTAEMKKNRAKQTEMEEERE